MNTNPVKCIADAFGKCVLWCTVLEVRDAVLGCELAYELTWTGCLHAKGNCADGRFISRPVSASVVVLFGAHA